MARIAGGPKEITKNINMDEWAMQADKYDEIRTDGMWNKALQLYVTMGLDHPFHAVRVREVLKWGNSLQYRNLRDAICCLASGKKCPKCGQGVSDEWGFCKYCGTKL